MRENWRSLLGKIVENEQIHKRLEAELNISAITIDRWIRGDASPRLNNVRALLTTPSLSSYHDLQKALMEEFQIESSEPQEVSREIPSTLYEIILKELTVRNSSLRAWGIIALCLNDMSLRLEAQKFRTSYVISTVAQGKHCLQEKYIFTYKNRITQEIFTNNELGKQSLPTIAIINGHDIAFNHSNNTTGINEITITNQENSDKIKSAAAFPLFRGGNVAGCFVIFSEIESYISLFHRYIEAYTALLALAFQDKEYYPEIDIQFFKTEGTE